jgi:ferredoxin
MTALVSRLPGNRFAFDPGAFHTVMGCLPEASGTFSFTYTDEGLYVLAEATIDRLTQNAWNNDGGCMLCGADIWGGGNCTVYCPADAFNMARRGKVGKPATPRQLVIEDLGADAVNEDGIREELEAREHVGNLGRDA